MLIALGVLRKEGRKIVSDRGTLGLKVEVERDERMLLEDRIRLKQLNLDTKRSKLEDLQMKIKSLNGLLNRNKALYIKREDSKISFPFIGSFVIEKEF